MSTAHRFLPKYTVEDYQQWKGDWELWQGIPVSMTPSPFGAHQQVAARLTTMLQNSIDSTGCRAVVLAEIDWIVSRDTVVRPDVLVLCGKAPERHVEQAPAIVAEIISASTEQLDRQAKFDLYREQCVSYYLIADANKRAIDAFHLDSSGDYERLTYDDEIVFEVCEACRLSISIAKAFA